MEESKTNGYRLQFENEKLDDENDEELDDYPWPCGFCHTCYDNKEDFEAHKSLKHGQAKMSMDPLDEKEFGKSSGPYHINQSLIKAKHDIDRTLINRIQANPKVLNAKAP